MRDGACDLCGEALADAGHRCNGLDLCESCYGGETGERVRGRGFSLHERKWVVPPRNDDDVPTHYTEVVGVAPIAGVPAAEFSREGLGVRVRRLFGGAKDEVQAGDGLFDDFVWVQTEAPDALRPLLVHEGLQMVIMEAVAELGSFAFGPAQEGGVRVQVRAAWTRRSQFPPKTGLQRLVACALHQLEQAARVG